MSPRHPARRARQARQVVTDTIQLSEWKATKLGFASRMGSTYRLDPLRSEELGELT